MYYHEYFDIKEESQNFWARRVFRDYQFRLLWQSTIDWKAYKQQKLISHSSGVWTPRSQRSSSGCRSLFRLQTADFSLYLFLPEKGSTLLTLIMALIPFVRSSPSLPHLIVITSQKSHHLIPSHGRVKEQGFNLQIGGGGHIQSIREITWWSGFQIFWNPS